MASKSTSLVIEVLTDASKAGKGLDQVGQKAGGLAGTLTKTLGGLALGAGILKFGTDSVKAAAQAEQAVGGVAAVFKGQSGQIEKAAAGAAKKIGLSTSAYEQLATVLGSQLKTAGFDDFADKTEELITLGGDLAAMYGGTTADAVSAISSLLKGERDPIEKFGVSMKQASIDAEVLALGLDTSTEAAKQQANAQASLSLLYKQTADAQGAAAREQDSASARYQQFQATVENLEAAIGSALLPTLSGLAEVAMDAAPAVQAVGEAVASTLAFVLELPGPVLAAGAAIAGLILFKDKIKLLSDAFRGFRDEVALQKALGSVIDPGQIAAGASSITGATAKVGTFNAALSTAKTRAGGIGKSLLGAFGGGWGLALSAAALAIGAIVTGFSDAEVAATDFGSAVDDATGKLDVLKTAEALDPATIDLLHQAGISIVDYATALANGGADADGFRARLQGVIDTATSFEGKGGRVGGTVKKIGEEGRTAGDLLAQFDADATSAGFAIQDAADKAGAGAPKLQEYVVGIGGIVQAAEGGEGAMDGFKAGIDAMGTAASQADTELQYLLLSLDLASGNAISAEQAMRANEAAIRGIGASARDTTEANNAWATAVGELQVLQDSGTATAEELAAANRKVADASDAVRDAEDAQSKANLDAQKTGLALATSAYEQEKANGNLAGAAAAANAVIEEQRAKFIAAQVAAGMEQTAAENLATKLYGIPGKVGTELTATDNATTVVDKYNAKLTSLDGRTVTTYIQGRLSSVTLDGKPINPGQFGFTPPPPVPIATPQGLAVAGLDPVASAIMAAPLSSTRTRTVDMTLAVNSKGSKAPMTVVNYNVTVNGALDPDAVARQINGLLRARDRRGMAVTTRRGLSA